MRLPACIVLLALPGCSRQQSAPASAMAPFVAPPTASALPTNPSQADARPSTALTTQPSRANADDVDPPKPAPVVPNRPNARPTPSSIWSAESGGVKIDWRTDGISV